MINIGGILSKEQLERLPQQNGHLSFASMNENAKNRITTSFADNAVYNAPASASSAAGNAAKGTTGSSGGGGSASYNVNTENQPYINQLNELYDRIMNRKPFQYDLNGDLLYQQMADQYTMLGKQAMMDTMGQAATLTGGYGNSFAQSVGNQAYQQSLSGLNDQIPALYQQAYNVYQGDTDRLLQQYELAAQHPSIVDSLSPKTYTIQSESGDSDGTEVDPETLEYIMTMPASTGNNSYWNELYKWVYNQYNQANRKK